MLRLPPVELDDRLVHRAEQRAAEGGWTCAQVVEVSIAWWLHCLDREDQERGQGSLDDVDDRGETGSPQAA